MRNSGSPTFRAEREAGTTTIEALVAIAIVSLMGAVLLSGAGGGIRAARRAVEAASHASTLLRADDSLRAACSRVLVPYFERAPFIGGSGASIQISWYGGKKDALLRVFGEDGALVVSVPGASFRLPSVTDVAAEPFAPSKGSPRAVRFTYTVGNREYVTIAPLGAWPLPKEGGS